MKNKDLFEQAIEKWGTGFQHIMVMEECAELIKECSKQLRGRGEYNKIIEEMADVSILIDQLKVMHGISEEEFENVCDKKIQKLVKMLDDTPTPPTGGK